MVLNKKISITLLSFLFTLNSALSIDLGPKEITEPVINPTRPQMFEVTSGYKKARLTQNDIVNQYNIAMEKFKQSNIKSAYQDFKLLITNTTPCDYTYLKLSKEMASLGFFSLAELSLSKVKDKDISSALEDDLKLFYYPDYKLTYSDQIYLAEIYSNIMFNDQSKEATTELLKQTSILTDSDYANYLVALGSLKNGDINQAKISIQEAINKNPKNINYKKLKAEIYAMSDKPQLGLKYFNDINQSELNTVYFTSDLQSTGHYLLYKISKNDYMKKYYLAYYYYDNGELTKSLKVLQTAISGKKNLNKDVYALTAVVYYDMKEFEKAQDYALKALNINNKDAISLQVLGNIAQRNKDYNSAQSFFKKAMSNDIDYKATIALAKLSEQQGNIKKAKELYSKVLKDSSKAYEAYYHMALLEKDRKVAYLKKTLSINIDYKDAWIDLADYEINKNSFDLASLYLNIAKNIDNGYYRYYYYYGVILKEKGLIAEANKNFEKCYKLNPEYKLVKEELNI